MLFWHNQIVKRIPLRILLVFGKELSVSHYLLSELDKNTDLGKKLRLAGAFSTAIRSKGTDLIRLRGIECRIIDKEMFFKKRRHLDKKKAANEYLQRIEGEISEFDASLAINDNSEIESVALAKALRIPVIESLLIDLEGGKLTTFYGSNAVRNAILSSKRYLQAGAFLIHRNTRYLTVVSKILPLDLERLSKVKDSEGFEKYVDIFKEKFNWSCSGPVLVEALKLLAEKKVCLKWGKLHIKDSGRWKKGFYDMRNGKVTEENLF